jgi:NDP-sugar pyrophosphorylase family protein
LEGIDQTISEDAIVSPEANIIGPVHIAEGARILPGAQIEGPAFIGKNALIGSFGLLRGGTFVGNDSVIGSYCECDSSVIGPHTGVFHFNVLSHSLVGRHCHITSFVVTGSTRPDMKPVVSEPDIDGVDEIIQRGCVMKPSTYVGPHVHVQPDTAIGEGCAIGSFVRVEDDIPSGTYVSAELTHTEQESELDTVGVNTPPKYPFENEFE